MVSFWTEPFSIFWIFIKRNPSKNKKVYRNCFDKQGRSWTYSKMFRKKHKNFKAIWAVLGDSKSNIYFLRRRTMVADISSRFCPPSSPHYFNVATALNNTLGLLYFICQQSWKNPLTAKSDKLSFLISVCFLKSPSDHLISLFL